MKVQTEYICEICGNAYDSERSAIKCESRGYFDPTIFPVGLMYPRFRDNYIGVFAIASIQREPNNPHYGNLIAYACRIPGYPFGGVDDNQRCDGIGYQPSDPDALKLFKEVYYMPDERINNPEFNAMVEGLRKKGITPRYYNKDGELIEVNGA